MHKKIIFWMIRVLTLISTVASLQASEVVISEFMAVNNSIIMDEDGDYSDWLELHNVSTGSVNMAGWYLTDDEGDLTQWSLPAITLAVDEYLIVFASEKDRTNTGSELHTNFKLSSSGEFLGLVRPDGSTIEFAYAPAFTQQVADISYGFTTNTISVAAVEDGASCRIHIPLGGALGDTWTARTGFDDSTWSNGNSGVGYDTSSTYTPLIQSDVEDDMLGQQTTVYIRYPFTIENLLRADTLRLLMKFDDGYIAYLNGVEIASSNAPALPAWDSFATSGHQDSEALTFKTNIISGMSGLLQPGTNVLAIHGLNRSFSSSDFLILPELHIDDLILFNGQFLDDPTPGDPNTPPLLAAPTFSVESGFLTSSTNLTLSIPGTNAVIYYTNDGSPPTTGSTLYTSSILINTATTIKAIAYAPAVGESMTNTHHYNFLDPDVLGWSSDIPVFIIDTFGESLGKNDPQRFALSAVFETNTVGRTTLTNLASWIGGSGVKVRGSSTSGQNKKQFSFELFDQNLEDMDVSLLQLPAESDWVLWAPYNFDRALMRNPFIYELGEQTGLYTTRTRYFELFLNTGGGNISSNDYWGLYVLTEKIKRGKDRVDVEKMDDSETEEPHIAGGYITKIDRADPGDSGFVGAGLTQRHVYPKEDDITPAQLGFLTNFFDTFGDALYSTNWNDPETGYAAYIDTDTWIDTHIINTFAMNVDALRLSAYYHKPRFGKYHSGPLWDFDRSMDSTDGRDNNFDIWNLTNGSATAYFEYPWWERMFEDPDFMQHWIDRWFELRETVMSHSNQSAIIDNFAATIEEAQERNFERWDDKPPRFGGWTGEVAHLKYWTSNRLDWIDAQFAPRPVISPPGGSISSGSVVTITAPSGTVYFTTSLTDPRGFQGIIETNAVSYGGGITLTQSMWVHTRALWTTNWSAPQREIYNINPLANSNLLAVSEINYHPYPPTTNETAQGYTDEDDFEFIELQNFTAGPIDLTGARFVSGIEFDFTSSDIITLQPDEFVLLVNNRAAFELRYGTGRPVAGEYGGQLANNGEHLRILDINDEILLDFTYNDNGDWPGDADGDGFTLQILDTEIDPGNPTNWVASLDYGGSPGTAPSILEPQVRINEVLAHTDLDTDWIELYNISTGTVDLGGWLLSDTETNLAKYVFPSPTLLPANGYLVVDETDFNNAGNPASIEPFALSELGDDVYLYGGSNLFPLTFQDHVDFGANARERTLGIYEKGDGSTDFTAMASATKGSANSAPLVGPIVISELMVHPASNQHEFIELANIASTNVPLFDSANPTNTWKLTDAVSFTFPPGQILTAGRRTLIVNMDPFTFRTTYDVPAQVAIFGPYDGQLNNSGESVKLRFPGDPEPDLSVPYILGDRIDYFDSSLWPTGAHGTGASLERIDVGSYGNEASNWRSLNQIGSPGTLPQLDEDGDGIPDNWEQIHLGTTNAPAGDPDTDSDTDGSDNLDEYIQGTDPNDSNSVHQLTISMSNGIITVTFPTFPAEGFGYYGMERWYDLETSTNLMKNWSPHPDFTNLPATGLQVLWSNETPTSVLDVRTRTRLE